MSNDSMIEMSLKSLRSDYSKALAALSADHEEHWILTCDDVAIEFVMVKRKYIVQKCNTLKAIRRSEAEAKALAPAVVNPQGVQSVAVKLEDALITSIRKINEMLEQIDHGAQLGFR